MPVLDFVVFSHAHTFLFMFMLLGLQVFRAWTEGDLRKRWFWKFLPEAACILYGILISFFWFLYAWTLLFCPNPYGN